MLLVVAMWCSVEGLGHRWSASAIDCEEDPLHGCFVNTLPLIIKSADDDNASDKMEHPSISFPLSQSQLAEIPATCDFITTTTNFSRCQEYCCLDDSRDCKR